MSLVRQSYDGNTVIVEPSGHITANNAQDVEEGLLAAHRAHPMAPMVLDCSDLEYISSSGLRVVLRVLKAVKRLSITNVLPTVYEVFDMTGFTMMMDVRKAYRCVSVDGCRVIGRGLLDRQNVEQYLGISYELSCRLWDLILRKRFPNATDAQLKEAENKVRLLSAVRLMGRPLRHANIGGEVAKRTFELYGSIIDELLPSVSTLAL